MGTWEFWRLALLGICTVFLAMSYFVYREGVEYRRTAARQEDETHDFLSRAVRAPAYVVGVEERTENLNLTGYYRTYREFCPVVEFRTWQGEFVQTRLEVGVERNPPGVGQQVEICYDSARPQRARLNGPALYPPRLGHRGFGGCLLIGHAVIMALGGIIGIVGALFVP